MRVCAVCVLMFVCAVRVAAVPLSVVQVVRWEWGAFKALSRLYKRA